jgi:co-chaperonin GroES (HSP10)
MTEIVNGTLRLLSDRILLKPLDWQGEEVHGAGSRLVVVRSGRPLRGVVIAVGRGHHPVSKRTNLGDGRRRVEYSKHFRPTEVKPGDVVELGGLNVFDGKGYQFVEILYNGEKHLICSERDVCIVREDARAA